MAKVSGSKVPQVPDVKKKAVKLILDVKPAPLSPSRCKQMMDSFAKEAKKKAN